ncbi:13102_t:CDS:1, partial [Racocetra fulgida]
MSPQRKFGRKKKTIWQWFSEGEKINSSHYLARCNFYKQNCPGEPSKMAKHLLEKCEDIHQDERNNIEDILKNTDTKNLEKKNLLSQDDDHNTNTNNKSKTEHTSA